MPTGAGAGRGEGGDASAPQRTQRGGRASEVTHGDENLHLPRSARRRSSSGSRQPSSELRSLSLPMSCAACCTRFRKRHCYPGMTRPRTREPESRLARYVFSWWAPHWLWLTHRTLWAVYFFVWLVLAQYDKGNPYIYVTHWTFFLFTFYQVVRPLSSLSLPRPFLLLPPFSFQYRFSILIASFFFSSRRFLSLDHCFSKIPPRGVRTNGQFNVFPIAHWPRTRHYPRIMQFPELYDMFPPFFLHVSHLRGRSPTASPPPLRAWPSSPGGASSTATRCPSSPHSGSRSSTTALGSAGRSWSVLSRLFRAESHLVPGQLALARRHHLLGLPLQSGRVRSRIHTCPRSSFQV